MFKAIMAFVLALSIVALVSGIVGFGADLEGPATEFAVEGATTIDLTNVTTMITDLFTELIPLIAIMSIFGGLMQALPSFFKFKMD